jgi:hypothetical protein
MCNLAVNFYSVQVSIQIYAVQYPHEFRVQFRYYFRMLYLITVHFRFVLCTGESGLVMA